MNNIRFLQEYPYTDFHELNLDWIISKVLELNEELKNFVNLNTIKYANPIIWDITSQYETNTVVIDGQTGNAYISTQPVPMGVGIGNTDYWTPIFNYSSELDRIEEQIGAGVETGNTATKPYNVDDLVFVGGLLYRVTSPMIAGDSFVLNSNCVKTTVSDEIERLSDNIDDAGDAIGNMQDDISVIQGSIMEIGGKVETCCEEINQKFVTVDGRLDTHDIKISNIDNYLTTINGSILRINGEINNIDNDISNIDNDISNINTRLDDIGDEIVHTYVNVKTFGAKGDGITDDTNAIQACIDSVEKSDIYFPEGEYVINGTVVINKSSVLIMGSGYDSVITRTVQSDAPVFKIGDVNRIWGTVFHNLLFTNIEAYCFTMDNTSNTYIHDITISKINHFVELTSVVERNLFTRIINIIGNITGANGSTGTRSFVDMHGLTTGLNIENCQINSEVGQSEPTSYFVTNNGYGLDTLVLRNNLVQRMNIILYLSNTNTTQQNIFISENIFDGIYSTAYNLNVPTATSLITRIQSVNNWFGGYGGVDANAIVCNLIAGTINSLLLKDEIFVGFGTRCLISQGTSNLSSLSVQNCRFNGFGSVNTGATNSCITLTGAVNSVLIENNDFTPLGDAPHATQSYGIYLATSVRGGLITGNNFNGVTTPITGTGTSISISNNYGA